MNPRLSVGPLVLVAGDVRGEPLSSEHAVRDKLIFIIGTLATANTHGNIVDPMRVYAYICTYTHALEQVNDENCVKITH